MHLTDYYVVFIVSALSEFLLEAQLICLKYLYLYNRYSHSTFTLHSNSVRSVNNQNIITDKGEKQGIEPDDDTTKTRHKLHPMAHSITPIVELELGRCDVMRRSPPSAK